MIKLLSKVMPFFIFLFFTGCVLVKDISGSRNSKNIEQPTFEITLDQDSNNQTIIVDDNIDLIDILDDLINSDNADENITIVINTSDHTDILGINNEFNPWIDNIIIQTSSLGTFSEEELRNAGVVVTRSAVENLYYISINLPQYLDNTLLYSRIVEIIGGERGINDSIGNVTNASGTDSAGATDDGGGSDNGGGEGGGGFGFD